MSIAIMLVGLDCPMRSLADPIGERMIDESALEDRLHHGAERMMDDAVAKRRRRDESLFGSFTSKAT